MPREISGKDPISLAPVEFESIPLKRDEIEKCSGIGYVGQNYSGPCV